LKLAKYLILIILISYCASDQNDGVVSLSEEQKVKETIAVEDHPIVLTECLNEEKNYNIATPFDIQDLKTTLDQMSNTKEERTQLLEDVDFCVNKYNLFSESNTTNPEELSKLYDENLELARCLREKGVDVADPTQEQPKLDLSALKDSKEEIVPLLQECGYEK
tara:strand:- start:887 stop:1378 length:492 start_codon:yes stop_codon:yes gene_type:complete